MQETSDPVDPRVNLAHERTTLAGFRTQLALDRTTLAWIRTTLTMATFGFGTVAFFRTLREQSPTQSNIREHEGAIQFGTALVVLGIVATIFAAVTHWRTLRRLRCSRPPVLTQWPLSITVAMLMAIVGFAALWSVFP